MGSSNRTGDGSLLLLGAVLDALAGKVGSTALCNQSGKPKLQLSGECVKYLGGLEDDGRLLVAGSLEHGNSGRGGGNLGGLDKNNVCRRASFTLTAGMAKPFWRA